MTIDLVSGNEVAKDDKRNSKKRFLPTDAVCVECGCINNTVYDKECVICACKCGSSEFIYGKLSIDLRLLLDLKIENIKDMCETRDISMGSRAEMTVKLLESFDRKIYDERVDELLIKKIMKRNKRKFYFTVDLVQEVSKVKREIHLALVKEEDVMKR